jgi:hypothetical protein
MKTELTALTRPRMSSGVSSCTRVWRMTTLTMSAAPPTASISSDSQKWVDRPKTMVLSPYTATAPSSSGPVRRRMGQRVSSSDMASAPTAGALRSRPRPAGPTCSTSLANMGSSAVAPPSSTANRSSDTAPSTALWLNTKRSPASSGAQPMPRGAGVCS